MNEPKANSLEFYTFYTTFDGQLNLLKVHKPFPLVPHIHDNHATFETRGVICMLYVPDHVVFFLLSKSRILHTRSFHSILFVISFAIYTTCSY